MIKIHKTEDLEKLNHLENKKKILARFVLHLFTFQTPILNCI